MVFIRNSVFFYALQKGIFVFFHLQTADRKCPETYFRVVQNAPKPPPEVQGGPGQTQFDLAWICTAGNACVVCRGTRACPCARARELLARVPGALARACPTRARVQGPGTHACPCARARGHSRRGHSRECPCGRAPTTPYLCQWIDSVLQIQANSWIDSVVQIQAPIVFLGAHGVEIVLHLAKYGLMKLVPIYMFSVGAGTKT